MKRYRLIYIMIVIFAVVFSQCYMGNLSLTLLISVLVLPVLSFLLLLAGFFLIKVNMDCRGCCCEKETDFKASVEVRNRFFVPTAPAVILVRMPDPSSADLAELVFSALPFRKKMLNLSYRLKYRGEYTFSLNEIRMYDFLHIFCLRKKLKLKKEIIVLPRQIELAIGSEMNDSTEGLGGKNSPDGSELSYIRKYQDGDDFRRIHWKLSARQDEYMVKQMADPDGRGTVIYCDFRAYGVNGEENAAAADRAAEAVLALILRCVKRKEDTVCVWYNGKDKVLRRDPVTDRESYEKLFGQFARAALYGGAPEFTEVLASYVGAPGETGRIFAVTPRADDRLGDMLERMSVSMEVLLAVTGGGSDNVISRLEAGGKIKVCRLGDIKTQLESALDQFK